MRAPSTKTGFLLVLVLLAEDKFARRPQLALAAAAAAAAREDNVAARADRIVVVTPW